MCSSDIPGPDPRIGLAALETAQLSREALDWYKDYSARVLEPAQRDLTELNKRVTEQSLRIGDQQESQMRADRAHWEGTFRPVEQAVADEAMGFDKAGFADSQAAKAQAGVEQSFAVAAEGANRDLARRGMTLSAAQLAAQGSDMDLAKAAAMAGASNQARTDADAVSFARKIDAASLGRGIANQQSTAAQVALSGGNQASTVQGRTSAGAGQAGQFVGQGYNTAIGGIGTSGSLFAEGSRQNQYAAAQNAQNSGGLLGTLAGAGTSLGAASILKYSDKNVKKDRKKVKPSAATLALENMDVETFEYDPKKVPELADGATHMSPTAQDFAENVRGDGKRIDLRDEIGVTMAAVKDVNERLKKVEKRA